MESTGSGTGLGVGDPAPPLQIDQWVTGTPVSASFDGKVHVVEFWATWCGPCLAGMPHISALQEEYGEEVTIIGVTDEDVGTVEGFLASESTDGRPWSEVISYRLVTDDNQATNTAYMKAANQNGIPTAFIVGREGTIEWIGHPGRIDSPLRQVVDGTWSREAAAKELEQQQRLAESRVKLRETVQNQDWDGALAILDELDQGNEPAPMLLYQRLSVLQAAERHDEAAEVRGKIVDVAWDDAMLLNSISWDIATADENRDLDLALKAATRASELTGDENAAILDTLARVHHERGDLDAAIEWQRKAVEHNIDRAEISAALKQYLAEKGELAKAGDDQAGDDQAGDDQAGDGDS